MEISRLDELFNSVNLRDVIVEETENRIKNVFTPEKINSEDFHEHEEEEHEEETEQELEVEEPYDAEKNARSLVYGLQTLDTMILHPIGFAKVRHSAGGGKVIKSMRAAYVKNMSGEKLDETEERLLVAFATYKRDLEILSDELLPTPTQTEELIKRAVPYCEESKIKFGAGLAFWGAYTAGTVEKIAKIALK